MTESITRQEILTEAQLPHKGLLQRVRCRQTACLIAGGVSFLVTTGALLMFLSYQGIILNHLNAFNTIPQVVSIVILPLGISGILLSCLGFLLSKKKKQTNVNYKNAQSESKSINRYRSLDSHEAVKNHKTQEDTPPFSQSSDRSFNSYDSNPTQEQLHKQKHGKNVHNLRKLSQSTQSLTVREQVIAHESYMGNYQDHPDKKLKTGHYFLYSIEKKLYIYTADRVVLITNDEDLETQLTNLDLKSCAKGRYDKRDPTINAHTKIVDSKGNVFSLFSHCSIREFLDMPPHVQAMIKQALSQKGKLNAFTKAEKAYKRSPIEENNRSFKLPPFGKGTFNKAMLAHSIHGYVIVRKTCNKKDVPRERQAIKQWKQYDSHEHEYVARTFSTAVLPSKHNEDRLYHFLELCPGDFAATVNILRRAAPSEKKSMARKYLMLCGLKSIYNLHKEGLFHRDLKPGNMRFSLEGVLKLIDMGSLSTNKHNQRHGGITYKYVPMKYAIDNFIEKRKNGTTTADHDKWAMGVCLLSLYLSEDSHQHQYAQILNQNAQDVQNILKSHANTATHMGDTLALDNAKINASTTASKLHDLLNQLKNQGHLNNIEHGILKSLLSGNSDLQQLITQLEHNICQQDEEISEDEVISEDTLQTYTKEAQTYISAIIMQNLGL